MSSELILTLFVAGTGLIIGSFLNVCIYRIPRKESLAWPASHCPECGHELGARDLIPLLSFFLLGRRCRYCRSPIRWRYPLVEGLTAILWLLAWLRFGASMRFLATVVFVSLGIVMAFIDLDLKIIPDLITLPGMAVGLLLAILPGGIPVLDAAIGMVAGAGLLFLVAVISRGGMGGGDAKLLGMIGAFFGWKGALAALFLGSLSGALVGLALMITRVIRRRDPIPFGPFLVLGGVVFAFFGDAIFGLVTGMMG